MTNSIAWRRFVPDPTHLAAAGFGIAGAILVALDLQRPVWAVTNTISSYATSPVGVLYVIALLAAAGGVLAAVLASGRSVTRLRPGGLMLMVLWPIGIAMGTVFDQAENTWTGMVHNVAVGAALVAVHVVAVRMGSRLLTWVAAAGFGCMAWMVALLVLHTTTGAPMPIGLAERALVTISVLVVIGTFRVHGRLPRPSIGRGVPFVRTVPDVQFSSRARARAEG
ncbi:hypothetical protein [Pseudonocardia sp. GCM10023141]|uniref:hypothetical protein n=1 Tax=Pseudonocardia sp. GCM10023141 TaxID=3252653 RepID=UPI0036081C6E